MREPWGLSRHISQDGRATPGRRFRELPKDMPEALQTRLGALLHKPRSFLGRPPQVHGYQPGTAHRCQQAPLCRKRLARWHIHGEQALLQGKQPLPKRLQPPGGDELHHVLRRD